MATLAGLQGGADVPNFLQTVQGGVGVGRDLASLIRTPGLLEQLAGGDTSVIPTLAGLNPQAAQALSTLQTQRATVQRQNQIDQITAERTDALRGIKEAQGLLTGGADSLSQNIKKWVVDNINNPDFDKAQAVKLSNLSITDENAAVQQIKLLQEGLESQVQIFNRMLGTSAGAADFSFGSGIPVERIINGEKVKGLLTTVRNKATGAIEERFTPFGGAALSREGESPAEKSARRVKQEEDIALARAEVEAATAPGIAGEVAQAEGEVGLDISEREKLQAGTIAREDKILSQGTVAAESTATIRRALTLLDRVKTGGINAISLRVKDALGISGADEGELSNSLGKAVLSQLRDTFGAAFTEGEGRRLERIEAGFGKSPAANRRLLGNALAISERAAKRALKIAIRRGDTDTVDDIQGLLNFTLGDDQSGQNTDQGEIMVDDAGNIARVFKDGRVEELQ